MKQEIIRSEYEPEKKFLWLHTKDGNLVLEAFGDQGWESVGNEVDNTALLKIIEAQNKKIEELATIKAVETQLTEIKKDCSKQEMISAIININKVLINSGLVK